LKLDTAIVPDIDRELHLRGGKRGDAKRPVCNELPFSFAGHD